MKKIFLISILFILILFLSTITNNTYAADETQDSSDLGNLVLNFNFDYSEFDFSNFEFNFSPINIKTDYNLDTDFNTTITVDLDKMQEQMNGQKENTERLLKDLDRIGRDIAHHRPINPDNVEETLDDIREHMQELEKPEIQMNIDVDKYFDFRFKIENEVWQNFLPNQNNNSSSSSFNFNTSLNSIIGTNTSFLDSSKMTSTPASTKFLSASPETGDMEITKWIIAMIISLIGIASTTVFTIKNR